MDDFPPLRAVVRRNVTRKTGGIIGPRDLTRRFLRNVTPVTMHASRREKSLPFLLARRNDREIS